VQSVAWQIGEVKGLGSDRSEDGMALGEEGIESPAKAIVVETGGGDVPQEVGTGVFGPGRDVDEGGGLAQPGGEEEAEDAAVGENELGVGRQMAVDDGGDVQSLQEWGNEGQGTEVDGVVGKSGSMPGLSHDASGETRPQECQGGRLDVAKIW